MQKKKKIKHWKIGYITFTENWVQISISLIHTYQQMTWSLNNTIYMPRAKHIYIHTYKLAQFHSFIQSITCASLRVICTMSPSSVRVIVDSSILSGLGAEESCRPGCIIKITYIIYTIYACAHTIRTMVLRRIFTAIFKFLAKSLLSL